MQSSLLAEPVTERAVAASALLFDPRSPDSRAYLALLRGVNHLESLDRHISYLVELLVDQGWNGMVGPVDISPHLGGGLLVSHWDEDPPLYTAYNPPFLPELVENILTPQATSRLYCVNVRHVEEIARKITLSFQKLKLMQCSPAEIQENWSHFLSYALPSWEGFPAIDPLEAGYLHRRISTWPVYAWQALDGEELAGFLVLQSDYSPLLRRAQGGRSLMWRSWLRMQSSRQFTKGRLVFFGLTPTGWQYQAGEWLIGQAVQIASQHGWEQLWIGPLPDHSRALPLLAPFHARPRQVYQMYR